MESPWRQILLLATMLGLPVAFASFCIALSGRKPGKPASYLAYFFLFGCLGQWLFTFQLWPSPMSRALLAFLLTAAPAACLGLAVLLQRSPLRRPFDTGAMVTCYLYPVLAAAGAVLVRLGMGR